MLDVCPKTEDFLEFLCFRSCPGIIPDSLSFFGDPLKHNFPNGVPTSDLKNFPSNLALKQENSSKAEVKCLEPKIPIISKPKSSKATSHIKTIPPVNSKTKLGVGRIHSSFRRKIVNSGVITRMSRLKSCSDIPAPKTQKIPNHKGQKRTKRMSPLLKRVATRSQLRKARVETSFNRESSSEDDLVSESADPEIIKQSSSPTKQRKVPPCKNKLPIKKAPNYKAVKLKKSSKKQEKLLNLPVSKNTRLSAAKSNQQTSGDSPARKSVIDQFKDSPVTVRRKPSLVETKSLSGKEKQSTPSSTSTSNGTILLAKISRENAKKIKNITPQVASPPTRRPSRRTKEAATFFMTLIGQEEEFYSSELEEQIPRNVKNQEKEPPKKKIRVLNGRKSHPCPPSSPIVRTRRGGARLSVSQTKRRETILQEATKRFSATQNSNSESSNEDDKDENESSSSSSDDDEAPIRSIRTRSFDPSLMGKSPLVKPPEEIRKTRATATRKKSPDQALSKEGKNSIRIEHKKISKTTPEKSEARKRPIAKGAVVTPPLNYDLSSLIEAPVFHPNEKEFSDPLEYLEKIRPECERFGICRIVPPSSFKPECQVSDAMRFTAYNQYIHRMFRRRGSNSRILAAIHRHLRGLNIDYSPAPCIGGIEVDLPGLYEAVQDLGGPSQVLESNLWSKVADTLKVKRKL